MESRKEDKILSRLSRVIDVQERLMQEFSKMSKKIDWINKTNFESPIDKEIIKRHSNGNDQTRD